MPPRLPALFCVLQLCVGQSQKMTRDEMAAFPGINKVLSRTKPTTGCKRYSSCTECSADPSCAWCLDRGFGACQANLCSCEKAYKALFPGLTMEESGPCSDALKGQFKPGTCHHESTCPAAAENMINSCKGKKIPNIPPGNPTAGHTFDRNRGLMIKMAYKRAGCPLKAALPPPPTPLHPTAHYTVKVNFRGDCPEDKYTGSMCNVKSSRNAQELCAKNKHCLFYVWSGQYGQQFDAAKPPSGSNTNDDTFPYCMWMCQIVPKIFPSWVEGQSKYLEGWESGWKTGATHTPSPTPPPLHKVTAKVQLTGISKESFDDKARRNFCIAVADVVGVPDSDVSITSVATAPAMESLLRRLREGSIGGILVTFCISTTDAKLEQAAEAKVKSEGFGRDLKADLSKNGIKAMQLTVGGHVQVQQQSQSDRPNSSGSSASTMFIVIFVVALVGFGLFAGVKVFRAGGAKTLLEGGWNPEDEIEPDAAETQSLTQNAENNTQKKKKKKKKKGEEGELGYVER